MSTTPKLHATFITMFEEPIRSFLNASITSRSLKNNLFSARIESILKSVSFNHHAIDDTLYGGGPGELIKIDKVVPLIQKTLYQNPSIEREKKRVLLMDPSGEVFTQDHAKRLAQFHELIFVIGRYEGIDARIHHYVDEPLSLGDFVLTSGDLAAVAIFDATARMIDGHVGNIDSVKNESHFKGRLEGSHYTRPSFYDGFLVPEILQSGNHREIDKWRLRESVYKTKTLRPDLIAKYPLDEEEKKLLDECLQKNLRFPWMK